MTRIRSGRISVINYNCAGAKGGENMAKVKVIEGFKDREDNLKYKKKDSVLTVSEERARKLEGLGFVKRIPEIEKQEKDSEKMKG